MTSQYETIARNSGKTKEQVDEAYGFVQEHYGKYLKSPELIWWQVCNRLKLKVDAPTQNKGGAKRQNRALPWADLKTLSNKESVDVEGMVLWVRNYQGNGTPDDVDYIKIGLLDNTGKGAVKCKSPEILPLLQQQNITPGDFVTVKGGYGWVMPVADAKDGELRGVSVTKYTQVQVNKKFNPQDYFPSADTEGLEPNQPCFVQGIVLQSKIVMFKACPHVKDGRVCGQGGYKDATECFRGHTVHGEWGEAPNTFLTLHSESGTHEIQMEGTHNYDGMNVSVIGQNIVKKDSSVQIRCLSITVKDAVQTGSAVLKRDAAKSSVMRTLRSYKRFPLDSTMNRIKDELGTKSDVEAEAVLNELISAGSLARDGGHVRYVSG